MILSTSFGGQIVLFNGTTGGSTVLGSYNYPGPVAVDSSNNVYIGDLYDSIIAKVPYVGGTYAVTPVSSSTPVCTGSDTTECTLAPLTTATIYGYTSMAFDVNGNFYFTTTNSGPSANSIFECTTACFAAGSASAVLVYQEPTQTGNPLILGGIAADSLGDLFFTDSYIDTSDSESTSSNLNELAALSSSPTLHSATAQVLYTYTDASPAQYDDQLVAVAVDSANTVYFATEYDGIYALLNNGGTVDTTSLYTVSNQGGAVLTTDRNDAFYAAAYSNAANGDAAFKITVGKISVPTAAVGASSSTTTVSTILTAVNYCGSGNATTLVSSTAEFSATAGACSANYLTGASNYATTVSFTPATPGLRTATLTATNGTSSGTATVSAIATGGTVPAPAFNPAGGTYSGAQSVSISDSTTGATIYYTVNGSTPTTSSAVYTGPISVAASETINAFAAYAGSSSSSVASAAYVIAAATVPTPTFSPAGGSYTTVQSVTISDTVAGAAIYYTVDGSTPTTTSTLYTGPITVSSSETINAIATASGSTNSSVGSATYTLNLASTWIVNRDGTVTRLNSSGAVLATATPTSAASSTLGGIAIDATGNAWAVANQSNSLTKVSPAGAFVSGYTGAGITNPVAIVVDGQGYIWVANSNSSVSVFGNDGTAISPATGYIGGSLSGPSGIAIDQAGGVWVTNATSSTLTRIIGGAAPTVAPIVTGVTAGSTGTRP